MPPNDSVKLTLDRERTLAITWRGLEALESQHDISFDELGEMLQGRKDRLKAIRFVVWVSLLHEMPDLTLEETLDLMENANPFEIIGAVNKLMAQQDMSGFEGNGEGPRKPRGPAKKKGAKKPARKRSG